MLHTLCCTCYACIYACGGRGSARKELAGREGLDSNKCSPISTSLYTAVLAPISTVAGKSTVMYQKPLHQQHELHTQTVLCLLPASQAFPIFHVKIFAWNVENVGKCGFLGRFPSYTLPPSSSLPSPPHPLTPNPSLGLTISLPLSPPPSPSPLSPDHSPDRSSAFLCVVSRRSLAMNSCSSSLSSEKSG